MSFFKRIEQRALPQSIDPYQITARPYFHNYSGEIVTETSAFAHSALMAAVTLLADAISVLPLERVKELNGRTQKLSTPSVLQKPNDYQTMFEFIHQTVLMLALHGSAYIYAPRAAGELPPEMRNIHPNSVKTITDVDAGDMAYEIGKQRYSPKDIHAIHWVIFPGRSRGLSPLEVQRNTIGMGIAMDRFLSQFYGEGATPSSVLETDERITAEQAQIVRETWEDTHVRRRRPAVLTNGLKWRPITTSAADMQMIEHRESIIRDIARAYRIPLHLIAGSGGDTQTYQNVEQAGINFVRYTLLPWMRRLEDAISQMLPLNQKVKFNADEFMRADLTTRVNAQRTQIISGTLSPNEARQIENREPYEGGDVFFKPVKTPSAESEIIGTDAEPPE
jgi:HK97 family phage portal protein